MVVPPIRRLYRPRRRLYHHRPIFRAAFVDDVASADSGTAFLFSNVRLGASVCDADDMSLGCNGVANVEDHQSVEQVDEDCDYDLRVERNNSGNTKRRGGSYYLGLDGSSGYSTKVRGGDCNLGLDDSSDNNVRVRHR
ncbi:hypothetical protein B296_00056898 [Ensete ventricosum]|uniref:Uncharacterized protein n=1 Tax=Ensete ventricosum TaxID=4639 RepID=A0A426XTD5_ENSVE|nr:hypothetical protein B296_00056898 [Ensete ventricosum]